MMPVWLLSAALLSGAPDAGTLMRSFGKDVAFEDLGPPAGLQKLKGLTPDALQQAELILLIARLKADVFAEYLRERGLSVTEAELQRCAEYLAKRGNGGRITQMVRDDARERVVSWKANLALFHELGGRLYPTLIGLEAIDAQRTLLLRYETKKLIVFANPDVREAVLSRFRDAIDVSSDERSVKDFEAGPRCLH